MPASVAVQVGAGEINTPLLSEFSGTWFGENEAVWRRNTQKMHHSHLDKHIPPGLGALHVYQVVKADLLAFRAELGK